MIAFVAQSPNIANLLQSPGGEMVDARDFPPPADKSACGGPAAGRKIKTEGKMETLEHRPAAYALSSEDKKWIYKGSSKDLAERIPAHLSGNVPRTKNRLPLKLVYYEYFDNYTDARRREIWLKSGQGREWLKKQIDQ
ncbi:MAG: GIY-YIG nuclease family protein [Kiritimatiellales bacterium]